MITEKDAREQLKNWIVSHSKKQIESLADDTNIIEERIITSVQILDLILFIESITGTSISLALMKPGSFRSVDTIYHAFISGSTRQ